MHQYKFNHYRDIHRVETTIHAEILPVNITHYLTKNWKDTGFTICSLYLLRAKGAVFVLLSLIIRITIIHNKHKT